MFKKLLEKVGSKHLVWMSKTQKNHEVIDFSKFFASINSALILLPEQLENFGVALKKQKELIRIFPNTKFAYVVREKHVSLIPNELQESTIPILRSDLTAFGIPSRGFIKNRIKGQYDIIIDLNAEFDLVSTYINNKAKAKLRICLSHPQREPFYNLQVCIPKGQSIDQQIGIMIKYITNFIAPQHIPPQNLLPV